MKVTLQVSYATWQPRLPTQAAGREARSAWRRTEAALAEALRARRATEASKLELVQALVAERAGRIALAQEVGVAGRLGRWAE